MRDRDMSGAVFVVAVLLALFAVGVAQGSIDYCSASLPLTGGTMTGSTSFSAGTSIYLYNTADQVTNYERMRLYWSANTAYINAEAGGTGALQQLKLDGWGAVYAKSFFPVSNDGMSLGLGTTLGWASLGVTRYISGSKTKAIADNSATNFADVAIPQTAGSNHAGGQIIYTITCDNGVNEATQSGTVKFACQNRGGTEACGFGTPDGATLGDGTATIAAPVFTAAGGADLVSLSVQSDCQGIVPTTDQIQWRLDMPQPNTVTPK